MKKLVAYFSCSGKTKEIAERLAKLADADLYEIEPVDKYSDEDLDWENENSRSTLEMKNRDYRPPINQTLDTLSEYSIIYLGFPIWWYTAPTIINTFCFSFTYFFCFT